MIRNTLISEIDRLLAGFIGSAFATRAADNDVFEVYLFARAVAAFPYGTIRLGGGVNNFRTSPGRINDLRYTFATVDQPARLEIHTGVRARGWSSARHEVDLLIVHSRDADHYRSCAGNCSRPWRVLVAVEAKHWTTASVEVGTARGVLGLYHDLLRPRWCALAASRRITRASRTLLRAYGMRVADSVLPGTTEAARMDEWLRSAAQETLRHAPL
jgi:hypothetical protein